MTCSSHTRGPTGYPILGNALSVFRGALPFLHACAADYGDLVPLWFFRKRLLFVNHPDYIGHVLATCHRQVMKGISRRSDHILLGDGISLSEGDVWLRERRLIQTAFYRERLSDYSGDVVALTDRMLGEWQDGEVRDLAVDLTRLTLAIIGKTLIHLDAKDGAELATAVSHAMACRAARVKSPQMLLPDRVPSPLTLRLRQARRRIDVLVQRSIDARRESGKDRDDLLSLLLDARDPDGRAPSDRQVRDEVVTILVGGHETVADLLAWAWYLLSQHPDVEANLLKELDATLGGRLPTVDDLPRLPYTGMVVTEALRLYPPASVLTREAITDFAIGGYPVTRGTEIILSPWVMHRDPRYFVEPQVFRPERWADGLAHRLPRYAYFPFGGGPRLCIGKSFATMEAILMLATVVPRAHLALRPGQQVEAEEVPTLHPKNGLLMRVRLRQRESMGSALQPSCEGTRR